MVLHFIRIGMVIVLLLVCIFLPFLPGDYDSMAAPLSSVTQLFVMAGLMLVPIGIAWLVHEIRKQKKQDKTISNITTFRFAVASLVVLCLVILVASVGAFANASRSLGFIIWGIGLLAIWIVMPLLKKMKTKDYHHFNVAPLYLICIPLIATAFRFAGIVPAVEFSRNRAIQHSEQLVKDIEIYYQKNGHYPVSLLSIWEDYKPSVTGIRRYHYELNGDAYNLYFEQFSHQLTVKEIVMYNKLGQHTMTSHNQDLLLLTTGELDMQRGYFTTRKLPQAHWQYFWFD